jgi:hypothetical protein
VQGLHAEFLEAMQDVNENSTCTSRQALKNKRKTKQQLKNQPSCGSRKTETIT